MREWENENERIRERENERIEVMHKGEIHITKLKFSVSQKISRDTAPHTKKNSFCGANPTKNSVKIAQKGSKLKFLCPLKFLRFHQKCNVLSFRESTTCVHFKYL